MLIPTSSSVALIKKDPNSLYSRLLVEPSLRSGGRFTEIL